LGTSLEPQRTGFEEYVSFVNCHEFEVYVKFQPEKNVLFAFTKELNYFLLKKRPFICYSWAMACDWSQGLTPKPELHMVFPMRTLRPWIRWGGSQALQLNALLLW